MSQRLQIAIATNFFPSNSQPYRGRPMYEQLRALAKLADVHVLCLDPAYPAHKLLRPRTFLYRDVETSHKLPGLNVEYLQYPALPVITRFLNGYSCGRALVNRLDKLRPDVLIGFYVYPEGFGALNAARELNIPVVIGALGSDLRRIENYVIERLIGQTLRKSAFIVTVSDELRERAIQFGIAPEKCRTIHNGCDFSIFQPSDRQAARLELKIPTDTELILFTGRFVPLKGIRDLLEAVSLLASGRPRIHLACIGEGPLDREVRQRASQPDLRDHVTFTGPVDAHRIARWLAASDVFCLPSHSEGCPNVVIEALSCGRPVVASNVGGIPELMDPRCGILVTPKDPEQLAQGLAKALDKPWNEDEIVGSFRRSWDDMARETYEVARSVVGRSKADTN
jgi:glycosyltransferase involved in cell wall biosynthesis